MFDRRGFGSAIRAENLDGWLFYCFRHGDPLADILLDINREKVNTRPALYFLPAKGGPRKIVHAIESGFFSHLPGKTEIYSTRAEFLDYLVHFAGLNIALNFSKDIPSLSYTDHGFCSLLQEKGAVAVSSLPIASRVLSRITPRGAAAQEKASLCLHRIIMDAWQKIAFTESRTLCEREILDFIMNEFARENLVCDHPPVVAFGRNTADPHYSIEGDGAILRQGDLVQFDLWAKYRDGIYADISWVGYAGRIPDQEKSRLFRVLAAVRDETVAFIHTKIHDGRSLTGAGIDRFARESLAKAGLLRYVKHRTGHSIDSEPHGFGTNLDSIEFPDERPVGEGSCFSIEPGIYLSDYGMRTEINAYILNGKLIISGKGPQEDLLVFSR